MKAKTEKVIYLLFLFLLPLTSLAIGDAGDLGGPETGGGGGGLSLASLASRILGVLNTIPGLLIALALAYFLYGLLGYVSTTDPKKRGESREVIVYGVIALFVMTSVWAIVNLLAKNLNLIQ